MIFENIDVGEPIYKKCGSGKDGLPYFLWKKLPNKKGFLAIVIYRGKAVSCLTKLAKWYDCNSKENIKNWGIIEIYYPYFSIKEKKMKSLKKEFEKICNAYISEFEKKQEIDFEFWVGDEVGGIAHFGDINYFSFLDIKHDIDTKQPAGNIIDWINQCVENDYNINYRSYTMGLNPEQAKKLREQELKESKERMAIAESILFEEINRNV